MKSHLLIQTSYKDYNEFNTKLCDVKRYSSPGGSDTEYIVNIMILMKKYYLGVRIINI